MAYSELIKNFERIRDYMRQFYAYGFKSRGEYEAKSARGYDNERRRVESWLGGYMSFRQNAAGKHVFLAVDSRAIPANPLYQAFKAKSFTPGDITFHFYILDMLADGGRLTVREIVGRAGAEYLSRFENAREPDESTLRKKLKEYEALGLLRSEKRGRELYYFRNDSGPDLDGWREAAAFFSEADPLGAVGSFLLDRYDAAPEYFGFKHRYILHALDSEVLCRLLLAMGERRCVRITVRKPRDGGPRCHDVCPMKIYIGTQSGRQYLLAYHERFRKPMFFRLDSIRAVQPGDAAENFTRYREFCEKFQKNLWGVSAGAEFSLEHIEMTVRVGDDEAHIVGRLERERRCGSVTALDTHTYRFAADVYDAAEMLPWLRSFIGRIVTLSCSNPHVTELFYADLARLGELYGGDGSAVQ